MDIGYQSIKWKKNKKLQKIQILLQSPKRTCLSRANSRNLSIITCNRRGVPAWTLETEIMRGPFQGKQDREQWGISLGFFWGETTPTSARGYLPAQRDQMVPWTEPRSPICKAWVWVWEKLQSRRQGGSDADQRLSNLSPVLAWRSLWFQLKYENGASGVGVAGEIAWR